MDPRTILATVVVLCGFLVGLAYTLGLRTGQLRAAPGADLDSKPGGPAAPQKSQPAAGPPPG